MPKPRPSRKLPRYRRIEGQDHTLPPGHIAAEPAQQNPTHQGCTRRLSYFDIAFKCVECGRAEIWTASQQKWWYEIAKGNIHSVAKRCRDCRQTLRESHGGTARRSQLERGKGETTRD